MFFFVFFNNCHLTFDIFIVPLHHFFGKCFSEIKSSSNQWQSISKLTTSQREMYGQ